MRLTLKGQERRESLFKGVFFLSALLSVLAIVVISIFIFGNALPFLLKQGLGDFLFGTDWSPSNLPPTYGILPMIVGSLLVTAGAIVLGVPVGVLTAVFMVYFCPKALYSLLKPSVNVMAGIPSIVYGFFGLQFIVPWIRSYGGTGLSVLSAVILLGIMILPTIISLSETALRAISKDDYAASLALGASHERTVFKVMLPAARSGIFSAVILGVGRAIGETMAVILVAGNQPVMPSGLLRGVRTMTTNIVLEMAYASGEHREALITTAAVLFLFILLINAGFVWVKRRSER
ncbi:MULTISPECIES: phosphate ABC transporter permease subunit PstC [unclassified Streptococcus]|uniref:phosphate ABC transporter permease subunit PstC n=1 Tax=unclassified Streptococcus TaxID=2608887 RepID=UPI00359EDEE4